MGRNSRSNHAARKKRKQRVASKEAHRRMEDGPFGASENSALNLLVGMWEQLDEADMCTGTVVLHENGAFECQDGLCTEATIFDLSHAGSPIVQCSDSSLKASRHACVRCWNRRPHEIEPVCGGMVITHPTGEQECTANRMIGGHGCPGVGQAHAVRVPCKTLAQCKLCGTDNEAAKERAMRDRRPRAERRVTHHGGLLRVKTAPSSENVN